MDLPAPLQQRVDALCGRDAGARSVISDIIKHFRAHGVPAATSNAPKKPNLDFPVKFDNMSVILPERRKATLGISPTHVGVLLNGDLIHSEPLASVFNVVLCLAVPKRPKPTWNLVLTNLAGQGPWLVFTLPDAPASNFCDIEGSQTIKSAVVSALKPYAKYLYDDDASTLAVKAYVGAREGVLYLLQDFIFFGYKKPLVLMSLAEIESVSFTVITRLTFNVVVQLVDGQSHEFGMISHDFYEAISKYISKHGLDDQSLAEERKAKRQRTQPSALEEANAQAQEEEDAESSGDDSDDGDYTTNKPGGDDDSGGSGESESEDEDVAAEQGDEQGESAAESAAESAT